MIKKDIILIILVVLHLFFLVSILRIPSVSPPITNNKNYKENIQHQQNIHEKINKEDIDSREINKNKINNNGNDNNTNNNIKIKLNEKNVYVTFTNNAQYIKGIIALRMSMIKSDCKYGLIVFVTKEVPEAERVPLRLLDCDVREINMVDIPKEVTVQIERWRPAFTKFRAWQLTEFEKVIWLDSDMLLMKSLDHLFDLVDPSNPKLLYAAVDADANSCQYQPDRLKLINSGIMVLSPALDVYNMLVDGMVVVSKLPNQVNVNDQDVINSTLNWKPLSYPDYGVQINHCECEDSRLWNFQSTYFIHYTAGLKELPKPWKLLDLKSSEIANDLLSPMPKCIQQLYHTWLDTYNAGIDQIDTIVKLKSK
ncbi:hypothetical protein DICPUDRAFT_86718 [Dictyostelium purpureum]|uniref:Uncharacterized protein n=1 Tax=Dictyostelium purpureum TaxID=5786 RepID=F0ZDG2_DICPU|nr:uncharacterized protein DICPUDRAFT_86718 [Dictyostelium purpureum]EGC38040.1 hypothetical protein DICPUDRAFT_86718 [Dictyostelium purpureum]|eukprot:XP_003285441.1 hypothetical protein DICPUDRAFT_86718 [Dictyostelium purpureum]